MEVMGMSGLSDRMKQDDGEVTGLDGNVTENEMERDGIVM
jgi:hypothetical protein